MDHISNEHMRSYLLGQLSDDHAATLEEEYFSNREIFLKIQMEETSLIADYLDGKLSSAEKQRFTSRYLQIPDLQRKVEEVRNQRGIKKPAAPSPMFASWRMAFAIASIVIFCVGIWTYRAHFNNQPGSGAGQLPQPLTIVAIHISPGQVKGVGSSAAEFALPPQGKMIHLILELPGQSVPAQCQVQISRVSSAGHWTVVWTSTEPLLSSATANGQELILPLNDSLSHPGDYKVEAWTPDGSVSENYLYRITSSQN